MARKKVSICCVVVVSGVRLDKSVFRAVFIIVKTTPINRTCVFGFRIFDWVNSIKISTGCSAASMNGHKNYNSKDHACHRYQKKHSPADSTSFLPCFCCWWISHLTTAFRAYDVAHRTGIFTMRAKKWIFFHIGCLFPLKINFNYLSVWYYPRKGT